MLHIRRGIDGSYWIPRSDEATEAYLNANYVKLPNQLKWIGKIPSVMNLYKNIHKGQTGYIVGKGLSLDNVKNSYFANEGPVIALNEAIHKIEDLNLVNPIYGTQLDEQLQETCKPAKPTTKLFVGPLCERFYDKDTYKIIIDPQSLGLRTGCLSVEFAIMLHRYFGCGNLVFIAFDGCLSNEFDYANCIGYNSSLRGNRTRFASHKGIILEATRNINIAWVDGKGRRIESLT